MLLAYHIYRIWALPVACISLIACLHSTYIYLCFICISSIVYLCIICVSPLNYLCTIYLSPLSYLCHQLHMTYILPAYHLYLSWKSSVSLISHLFFNWYHACCLFSVFFSPLDTCFSGTRDELLSMSCDGTVLARVSFPEPGSSHLECFAITSRNEVSISVQNFI